LETIEHQLVAEALKLPNKTHVDSPVGGEDQNVVIKEHGESKQKEEVSHLEIGNHLDLLDFASGSKLSGSKFVFLKNEAALLELALSQWVMNMLSWERGFTALTTPEIARQQVVEACGF